MKNKSLSLAITSVFFSISSFAQNHVIGERFGGGIIFYVDSSGHHGLIAALADQSKGIQWYNGVYEYINPTFWEEDAGYGAKNTELIVLTQMNDNPKGNFAAKVCQDFSITVDGVTYHDWYLPSKFELNLLYLQQRVMGGFAYDKAYWSSSETDEDSVSTQVMTNGYLKNYDKKQKNYVRAIRLF